MTRLDVFRIAFGVLLAATGPAGSKELEVYISVDREGVAGTITGDQLAPSGFEYSRCREFTTREALAAVEVATERPGQQKYW